MKKITLGEGTIVFDRNEVFYELSRGKWNISEAELSSIKVPIGADFKANFQDDKLVMQFYLEKGFVPLSQARSQMASKSIKLMVAKNLLEIGKYFASHEKLVTIFDPLNFFVHPDGRVLILYRGLKGYMPGGYEEESIDEQVKRLVLFVFTSARFDELRINGVPNRCIIEEHRSLTKALMMANTLEQMERIFVHEQLNQFNTEEENENDQSANSIKVKAPMVKNKNILVGGIIAIAVFMISGIVYAMGGSESKEDYPDQYIMGLRKAATQDYAAAVKSFDQVDVQSLPPEDKETVVAFYANVGKIDKVSQLDPDFMKHLANNQSVAPGIKFEKAVLEHDYQQITKLKYQIVLDDRRYRIIAQAYLQLHDVKNAVKIAEESKIPSLIKYVNQHK